MKKGLSLYQVGICEMMRIEGEMRRMNPKVLFRSITGKKTVKAARTFLTTSARMRLAGGFGSDVDKNYRVLHEGSRRLLGKLGIEVKTIGSENIPQEGPVAFYANHKSFIDILALCAAIESPTSFLSAENMWNIALRGHLRAIDSIPVDRTLNPMKKRHRPKIKETQEKIQNHYTRGGRLITFPEGKMVHEENLAEFYAASFKTPTEDNVPIIPSFISGTEQISIINGKWQCISESGCIIVSFAPLIYPADLGGKRKKVSTATREEILRLKAEANDLQGFMADGSSFEEARTQRLGLELALDNMDELFSIITKFSRDEVKALLKAKYNLTDLQVETILEMKLDHLAGFKSRECSRRLQLTKGIIVK